MSSRYRPATGVAIAGITRVSEWLTGHAGLLTLANVRVRVLGTVEVDGHDRALGRRDRVVLAALAVAPGHCRSPEELAEALWGDDRPASWAKVVQGAIVRLRRRLGREAVQSAAAGYRLALAADELDVTEFERLVERGRRFADVNEPARALVSFEDALRLWRGTAFEDLLDWPAGRDESIRLAEVRAVAEERQLGAALACGRTDEAVSDARRLLSSAPFRERRWLLWAEALYAAGRQAEALDALRTGRRVLREEHGLDPGPLLAAEEQAILRQEPTLPHGRRGSRASGVCPYPGLAAFEASDSEYFAGREGEIASCLRRLSEHSLLVVVGPSGCGKSSLVRAGVVPALLRRGQLMTVWAPSPSADPRDALAADRHNSPRGAGLVVDQLEEMTANADPDVARAFLDEVAAWATRAPVLVTLRADHVADLALSAELAALAERGLHMLTPMSEAQLRRAVEEPARGVGLVLEPGLVDLLLRDVDGEAGALPLLSHALHETWQRREGDVLTVDGYLQSGGIRGAVAQTADQLYATLSDPQRVALRGLMLRLVTPTSIGDPVRTRLPVSLLGDQVGPVLALLVASRLVIKDDMTVAIAHESLATAWPRMRTWLDEDVEGRRILTHLQVAAEGWATAGRPPTELYRGARLHAAQEWRQRSQPMLTADEDQFLAASAADAADEAERQRTALRIQRRQNRRLRRLLAVVAVLLAVAVAAGLVAVRAQQNAASAATRARTAARAALAARLSAEALVEPAADTSLLLARQAVALADTPQTRADLLAALAKQRDLRSVDNLGVTGYIGGQVQVSPDGHRMLALQLDGVQLINLPSGRRLPGGRALVPGNPLDLGDYPAGFIDAGRTAVVSERSPTPHRGAQCTLRYFVAASGADTRRQEPIPGSLCGQFFTMDRFRITADGQHLVSLSGAQVRIWTHGPAGWIGPRTVGLPRLPSGTRIPRFVNFDRDGRAALILVEVNGAPFYRFWEVPVVVDLSRVALTAGPLVDPDISTAALAPDGATLAVGGYDGDLRLLAAHVPDSVSHVRLTGSAPVTALEWSTDGSDVIVGRSDGRTQMVPSDGLGVGSDSTGNRGSVVLVFNTGSTVLSMDDTGMLLVRDVTGNFAIHRSVPRPDAIAVGPGGTSVALGEDDGRIQLYDGNRLTPAGKPLWLGPYSRPDHTAAPSIHRRVTAMAISADGSRLAAGDRLGNLRVWSLRTRALLWSRTDAPVAWLAISPNGHYLATAEFTQSVSDPAPDSQPIRSQVRLWDLRTGAELAVRDAHVLKPRCLLFSADSSRLLVGFFDSPAEVLAVPTGKPVATITQSVSAAALSPDGSTAVLVDFNQTASIVDTRNWRVEARFPALVDAYVHLAFSPDGRFLFIADPATTAVWDAVADRLLVPSISLRGDNTNDAIFLAVPHNRDELVIASQTTLTRIDLREQANERTACRLAARHLTHDEWRRYLPGQPYKPACT